MKKKKWLLIAAVCFLLVLAAAIIFYNPPTPEEEMMEMLNRVENALGDEWKKQTVTKVFDLTYPCGRRKRRRLPCLHHYILRSGFFQANRLEYRGNFCSYPTQ